MPNKQPLLLGEPAYMKQRTLTSKLSKAFDVLGPYSHPASRVVSGAASRVVFEADTNSRGISSNGRALA